MPQKAFFLPQGVARPQRLYGAMIFIFASILTLTFSTGCEQPHTNSLALDVDGDGYTPFAGDCDDSDANVGLRVHDQDCDGALTEDDCNDRDASSTIRSNDADCEGRPTEDD